MCMQVCVKDLSFSYSGQSPHEVFHSTTITFSSGRISAVLGKSGSGKSTLLKLLAGLTGQQDQHRCISYGPEGLSPDDMARRGWLSICPQHPACLPWTTVYHNVTIAFRLQRKPTDSKSILALLDRFGLSKWRDTYPHALSIGMQARVALARAFVTCPEVVLLDEPFSSLDIGWKEELYSYLLGALSPATSTVVLVTHDLLEALYLADDIYTISADSKSIVPAVIGNPLKRAEEAPSFAALVGNERFNTLFRDICYDLSK